MKTGIQLIKEERRRQVEAEGYSPEHDVEHSDGSLAMAAACYATPERVRHCDHRNVAFGWPFEAEAWKPTPGDRVRELVKAGALIAAEIDRLQDSYPVEPSPELLDDLTALRKHGPNSGEPHVSALLRAMEAVRTAVVIAKPPTESIQIEASPGSVGIKRVGVNFQEGVLCADGARMDTNEKARSALKGWFVRESAASVDTKA